MVRCSVLFELIVWTTLTASTIGPGTVAVCAKAGADAQEALLWCVVVAAVVAWVLQEASGRLTNVSNRTLGDCAYFKMPEGSRLAFLRKVLACYVVFGGWAYEANNFAGTMAAVRLVVTDEAALYTINVLLGPLCAGMVVAGSTQRLSLLFSAVVAAMIVCFAAVIGGSGVPNSLVGGLVPTIPAGSYEVALGLVGTTTVPHNLLLSSALARGASARSVQRGVLLSASLSGLISLLILIVGMHVHKDAAEFELRDVADVLRSAMGRVGVWGFALGLFGAGVSSAMTVPLACAMAVEDMFGLRALSALATQEGTEAGRGPSIGSSLAAPAATASPDAAAGFGSPPQPRSARKWVGATASDRWQHGGRGAMMSAVVLLALIPTLARLPTIGIIMFAQVVNGLLLPCVAALLFACVNDARLMSAAPQSTWGNARALPCVGICCFLAFTVLSKQTVCRLVPGWGGRQAMAIALPCTLGVVTGLCLLVRSSRKMTASARVAADAAARRGAEPSAELTIARPRAANADLSV